jgi:hypothetical protein
MLQSLIKIRNCILYRMQYRRSPFSRTKLHGGPQKLFAYTEQATIQATIHGGRASNRTNDCIVNFFTGSAACLPRLLKPWPEWAVPLQPLEEFNGVRPGYHGLNKGRMNVVSKMHVYDNMHPCFRYIPCNQKIFSKSGAALKSVRMADK